jgi:uncharacterized protein (TIGR03435 family)
VRGPAWIGGGSLAIETIAQLLTAPAGGRPIVNRTGLEGLFDIELEWAAQLDAADGVSIFTAIQDQLGLKLESTREPFDVLVVDRVERASEN